ncbi:MULTISPECIES: GGDEF domain-containing protein [unclassified Undibacterium]|uniref:GGDEF domain-containing protein n=2 Tax=unclassified Undibacterium TaxID=2630295 RepID=UPI002AC943AE|nr:MULTISPECIES: GGDEF domain-containing protein [unclassified Undibacterium]MEB0217185.1 GGDEF domain-containing protein [Undibacterium sp. 5I2]WPX43560.1 GGDEF domain-containing protein [Undibacterium sp. CCC3.4]
MAETESLYKNKVMLLTQSFFIKDNKDELLLSAHKYDFDILFFDQMRDFVETVQNSQGNDLFVIDLDVLYNMQIDMQQQRRQTMFLSDLLQRLPARHNYVYLQTVRQGERFLLQQKLVDSNCLAYAEKPITNDMLIDKLFNLFGLHQRGETNTIVYLGEQAPLDLALLAAERVEVITSQDARSLHLLVKETQPDIVLIDEAKYLNTEALVRVLKKNIEFDLAREIILMQKTASAELARQALNSGFDEIFTALEDDIITRQLLNRINKIRASKDLISRDRATGLLNKVGLQTKALEQIRQASRSDTPLTYGIIDIDKFKTINDTWGHYFGDIVIKRLSLVLSALLGQHDLLSRFGGEEFVILFANCTLAEGQKKLDLMREAFGKVVFEVTPGEHRQFSFSGGVAAFPACKTENEMFLQADAMLYQAKQGGRNRICSQAD